MNVLEFLKSKGVKYTSTEHKPTFSAQRMAAAEHEPGKYVAKPVLVKVDGQMMMCVLDANHKVDLRGLKEKLGAKKVDLADLILAHQTDDDRAPGSPQRRKGDRQ